MQSLWFEAKFLGGFYQTACKNTAFRSCLHSVSMPYRNTPSPERATQHTPYVAQTLNRFAIVLSSTVYPHWALQSVSCLQTGRLYPLQMNRWSSGSGTGAIWTGIKGCVKFLHAWSMGLNGGVGGGWGLTLGRGRNRNRGGERELASNGSLMRDGQRGLYLITNQHSFEFSREGKCKL